MALFADEAVLQVVFVGQWPFTVVDLRKVSILFIKECLSKQRNQNNKRYRHFQS